MVKKIESKIGISQQAIHDGWMERLVKNEDGKYVYHHFILPGFTPIKTQNDRLIGWSAVNNSIAYNDFKRYALESMDIPFLTVFARNKEKDLDMVFEGDEYIKYRKLNPPTSIPIVMVMLYKSDVKLISQELGYPVINNSQF